MSFESHVEHECWEYRHCCIDPAEDDLGISVCEEQGAEFIEWLIETLESLENVAEGWRMVKAKIESDGGRIWLDVMMKRPLAEPQKTPSGVTIPHAA